jgi:hypothetical protein
MGSRLLSCLGPQRETGIADTTHVHGLAGSDLQQQWDACQFAMHGRSYSREFLTRMHHPFCEVLAALFLDSHSNAIRYNTYLALDACPRRTMAHWNQFQSHAVSYFLRQSPVLTDLS